MNLASDWRVHRIHDEWLVQFEKETVCRCDTAESANLIFRAVTAGKFLKPEYVRAMLAAAMGEGT